MHFTTFVFTKKFVFQLLSVFYNSATNDEHFEISTIEKMYFKFFVMRCFKFVKQENKNVFFYDEQ